MSDTARNTLYFAIVAALILGTGFVQSWNSALFILNMGLVSAIMALGVNLQWGFAGLFNVGIMGFVALGGLATVLVATPAVPGAWDAGGMRILAGLVLAIMSILSAVMIYRRMSASRLRGVAIFAVLAVGFFAFRAVFDGGVDAVEAINPATSGNIGGLNLPILLAWPVGGLLAAGAAWIIGKTALGLRSDYLAIATLGIAEIIIAVMKNEDWMARGVKNVIGLPRPVPYEIDLQNSASFIEKAEGFGFDVVTASTLWVKLLYAGLFAVVLIILFLMVQAALKSPWGRMMRAIRDNEVSSEAMGKHVTARHLQVFILGSAICGIAGAMITTLDGQLTPTSYQPLRFTFLVWVMVIVGGSGNNLGAVLGGFVIWFFWVQVEPLGHGLLSVLTSGMAEGSALKEHLMGSVAHMRLLTMGLILLLVLRFSPRGLIPEK
ncbi:branched-chain amino acid ABC transporter permease [Lentibacter algarum]|uniref:branched-chain amino acid ABC transporter permease n=1 Tax=Lentibacter algarum TaxID=576131 RepID=UPI001C0743DA|nr:branched-chain amino acid ABC transporter permease [Lentibacter algarum]MBU2982338.1 branched-chain amino acid ABC transporter permease [Lentibacter algarum]